MNTHRSIHVKITKNNLDWLRANAPKNDKQQISISDFINQIISRLRTNLLVEPTALKAVELGNKVSISEQDISAIQRRVNSDVQDMRRVNSRWNSINVSYKD